MKNKKLRLYPVGFMSIYLWNNPDISDKYTCIYDYDHSPDWTQFRRGGKLSCNAFKGIPTFSAGASKKKLIELDCLPNNIDCPIVNERVVEILQELASGDVEFFNTKIVCADGVFLNYKLVNITNVIECIDLEKSIYRKMIHTDAIAGYQKPVYKPNCMRQHLLVRDKDFKGNCLVSQTIYDRFHKEKIKGVELITPHYFYKAVFPRYYQDE